MDSIHKRIKELRLALNLTQAQFASRLLIKRSTIANYELGRNIPTDSVKSLIYREFSVSQDWLEHGLGSMFSPELSADLDKFLKNHGATELELLLVRAIFSIDQDTRVKCLLQIQSFLSRSAIFQSSITNLFNASNFDAR